LINLLVDRGERARLGGEKREEGEKRSGG